jgi:hypothetical protein
MKKARHVLFSQLSWYPKPFAQLHDAAVSICQAQALEATCEEMAFVIVTSPQTLSFLFLSETFSESSQSPYSLLISGYSVT